MRGLARLALIAALLFIGCRKQGAPPAGTMDVASNVASPKSSGEAAIASVEEPAEQAVAPVDHDEASETDKLRWPPPVIDVPTIDTVEPSTATGEPASMRNYSGPKLRDHTIVFLAGPDLPKHAEKARVAAFSADGELDVPHVSRAKQLVHLIGIQIKKGKA